MFEQKYLICAVNNNNSKIKRRYINLEAAINEAQLIANTYNYDLKIIDINTKKTIKTIKTNKKALK